MPRNRTSPTPATEPKTHRSARIAGKKPARVPSAPAPIPEFDASARHKEIAEIAYGNWLERAEHKDGSPEDDWLKAEIQVRARYAGQGSSQPARSRPSRRHSAPGASCRRIAHCQDPTFRGQVFILSKTLLVHRTHHAGQQSQPLAFLMLNVYLKA
jgi:hypothetical protein